MIDLDAYRKRCQVASREGWVLALRTKEVQALISEIERLRAVLGFISSQPDGVDPRPFAKAALRARRSEEAYLFERNRDG